jgi:hypothetical protein
MQKHHHPVSGEKKSFLALDCRYPTAPTTQKKSFLVLPDTVFDDRNATCGHLQKRSFLATITGFVLIRFRFTSEIQTSADRRTGADFARLGVWASCASVPDASTGTIQYRLSEAALCMPRSPASSSLVAHQKQPVSRDLWENRCPRCRARLRSTGLATRMRITLFSGTR